MEGILRHCNYRISCQPRGFEAPPAHSSGLGPLVPPEFPAETLVKGSRFAHGDPYFPPHVEKTQLCDATGHFPMQMLVGPFRTIWAPGVTHHRGNAPHSHGDFYGC